VEADRTIANVDDGAVPTERVVLLNVGPRPKPIVAILFVSGVAYVFAGFLVYWLRTGEVRVRAGTMTELGALVWLVPFFATCLVYTVGDIGPLKRLWHERLMVELTGDGLRWGPGGSAGEAIAWDNVGGVSASGSGHAARTRVLDRAGSDVTVFEGSVRRGRYSGSTDLGWEVAAVRPDLYRFIGARHSTFRGCVRR
jgi:hypothetical protein